MKKNLLSLLLLIPLFNLAFSQEVNYNNRVWAINCGYAGEDTIQGFIADTFNIQGTALWNWGENAISIEGVEPAAPARIYETTRFEWGGADVEYLIKGLNPEETYLVRLHWGELTSAVGGRIFDVVINAIPYEIGLDIFATNGVAAKALVRDYEVPASDTGTIDLLFTNVQADNALINGIEIFRASGVGTAPSLNANDMVRIFPNPAIEQLQVISRDMVSSVSIYNARGSLVYSMSEEFNGEKGISLEGFSKGIYIVKVNTSKGVVNKKLLIK